MRTARSLTVSHRILHTPLQPRMPPRNHAHPPATMHAPWQPHMPPSNHACPPATKHDPQQPRMLPGNHTCPPATTHAPGNHACPLATTHAPQQPCMPPATTHAPRQPCMPPPWTEFLTHASENITLPQTSFAGGKNGVTQKWVATPVSSNSIVFNNSIVSVTAELS